MNDHAHRAFERAEDDLVDRYNAGEMTKDEFNREMRELARDYRDEAERAAQDAYDREMSEW